MMVIALMHLSPDFTPAVVWERDPHLTGGGNPYGHITEPILTAIETFTYWQPLWICEYTRYVQASYH